MGSSRLHSPFDVVKVNGKTVLKKMMRGNKTIGFSSTTTRTSLLIIFLMYGIAAYGQVQPEPGKKPHVKIIYGALTAANGPIWVAMFQRHPRSFSMGLVALPLDTPTQHAMTLRPPQLTKCRNTDACD